MSECEENPSAAKPFSMAAATICSGVPAPSQNVEWVWRLKFKS